MNEIKNIREPLQNKEYPGTVTLAITIIENTIQGLLFWNKQQ